MMQMGKSVVFSVVLILLVLLGTSTRGNGQSSRNCSTYAFSNGRRYANCNGLPVLNAFIHWSYHRSNHSVDIAYRHTQINSSNWVAWALNPNGTGMIGSQALVAFAQPNGPIRAYTAPITGYDTTLQQGTLTFRVRALSAELIANNHIVIHATIQLPSGTTSFAHAWQHGDLSAGSAIPQRHLLTSDHLSSTGTINFAAPAAAPAPAPASASSPAPPPPPPSPSTPAPTTTSSNCPPHTFSNARAAFSECNALPVLNAFLHWTYHPANNSVDIAYRHTAVRQSNWVAWGLNLNGNRMVGTQALVAFVGSNGSIRAYTSPITSLATTLTQGTLSFQVPAISAEFVDDNQIIIYATIQLPAATTSFAQVWQHGTVSGDAPMRHAISGDNVRSIGRIDFATGASTAAGAAGGSKQRKRNVHGVLNVVSWGIMMPLGMVAARYLKVFQSANPAWFYLHLTCQTSAYIIGVAGWGTGIKLGSDSPGVVQTAHRIMGITLFALATLQVFALLLRPKPDHKYRFYWNIYHHGIGYTVIILSIVNIFEGFDILDPKQKWRNAYIGVLIFLGALIALLEAFTWYVVLKRKRVSDSDKNLPNGNAGVNGYHA